MTVSFGNLWHIMERGGGAGDPQRVADEEGRSLDPHSALLDSGEESKAMEAIRSGLHIRKDEEGDFWEDFIQVCGNSDAMSELLNVPKETITGWAGKIQELKEKVQLADQEGNHSSKSEPLPTGDTPTANFGGSDGTVSLGNDTKPMPS